MALTDKNIVITPNTGAAADPKLVFTAASASSGPQRITLTPYPISGGTLSFEGTAGQLFSITNSMSGTIFSANDVSGIPSIEVLDTGLVKLAQYSGNVVLGSGADNGNKLQVAGNVSATNFRMGNAIYLGDTNYSINYEAAGVFGSNAVFNNSNNIRSPIYYDYHDTGYYIDPASTSNSALRMRGGALFGPNTTWGAYLYVGGNGNVTGNATVCTTDGNIHIDANDTNHGIYLGYYTGDYTRIYNSARSPTFYDLDDTSYYVNPANTSNLAATYINTHLYTSYSQYNPVIQTSGVGESGLLLRDGAGSFRVQIYGASGVYGFLNSAWGSWDLKKPSGGNLYLNGQETYYYGSTQTYVERVYGVTDIRSPLFYDNNNTGYYIDPNSSSRLATVNADTLRSYNNIYLDNQHGSSIIGVYSSYRYQGIFAMGDAYRLAMDGTTTGNLYGMAWSHPNAGGTASNLNSHGLLLLQNGGFMAALSTNGTFSADVRGTIFYDYSNTAYYVDPAGTSQLSTVYMDGWLYKQGSAGIYFSGYSYGVQAAGAVGTYGNLATYGTGQNGWNGYNLGGQWTLMNSGNGDNIGIHSSNYSWLWYWDGTATTFSRGYTEFVNSARAPIFYDSNNTGYYVDPATNTRLNAIYADSVLSYGNVTAYASSDRKFKENIRAIPNALEIVRAVGGKLFDWTDQYLQERGGEDGYFLQKSDFGIVAQDLQPHLPQAVRTRQDGSLAVDYEKLCAVAFEAINALENRLAALERALGTK